MNPPIRRLLAFAGSVVAGLFGAIVLASPAQAHHPIVSGESECLADGQYKITWTVTNGNWDNPYMKIKSFTATPADNAVTGLDVGSAAQWIEPDASVKGIQYVPGTTKEATLQVYGIWFHKKTDRFPSVQNNDPRYKGVVKLDGTCKAEDSPTATFSDRCDGTVNVHLVNPTSTVKTFRIQGA